MRPVRPLILLFAMIPGASPLPAATADPSGPPPSLEAAPPRAVIPRAAGPTPTAAEWKAAREIVLTHDPAPRTVVRALWSDDALHIAMEAVETTPFTREPEEGGSRHTQDVFEIFIDPTGDARQYYELQVALDGALFFKNFLLTAAPVAEADGVLARDFRSREWWGYPLPVPPEIETASHRDPESGLWRVEVRLPAALLNRRRGGGRLRPGALRVNFVRHDWRNAREADFFYWSPVRPGHPHLSPSRMGFLLLEETAATR